MAKVSLLAINLIHSSRDGYSLYKVANEPRNVFQYFLTKVDLASTELSTQGFVALRDNGLVRRPRAADGKLINLVRGNELLGEFANFHRVAREEHLISAISISSTFKD